MIRLFPLSFLLPLCLVSAYDPLELPGTEIPEPVDVSITDAKRDRTIPLRIWRPEGSDKAPVILFSHGLGGSRQGNPYLGRHWADRGYIVVFMQHAGSDRDVWQEAPRHERMKRLKAATGLKQTMDRIYDVRAVLDALPTLESIQDRVDMQRIGMSGHSYGGVTTQAVSGQQMGTRSWTDDRIKAAVIMSPSLPGRGNPDQAFAKVTVPWFLMTGTKDGSPIKPEMKPEQRAKVFDHLPAGDHLMLVLKDAEHLAFGDGAWRNRKRNPNHHRVILAYSTAFWDAHLRQHPEAETWLKSEEARQLLEPGDVLRSKSPNKEKGKE